MSQQQQVPEGAYERRGLRIRSIVLAIWGVLYLGFFGMMLAIWGVLFLGFCLWSALVIVVGR